MRWRIVLPDSSPTMTTPFAATAMACGPFRAAEVPKPSSVATAPLPAIVDTAPVVELMKRMR
jgi:hypothetical protein